MREELLVNRHSTFEDTAARQLPLHTLGQIRNAMKSGALVLNGKKASPEAAVSPGDVVSVDLDALGSAKILPQSPSFRVIFEDDHLMVLDKPAGLSVIPERGSSHWPLMGMLAGHARECALCGAGVRFRVVHRLDRDTTGVLVLAKSAEAESAASGAFASKEVSKRYLAIVSGEPSETSGTIEAPLGPVKGGRGRMAVDENGKDSVTHWRVVEKFRRFALLEAVPLTGRTHQVRVHLAHAGLPLAVDELYGRKGPLLLSQIKKNYRRKGAEKPLIDRLTLHASSLQMPHPATAQTAVFEAPLPADFELALKVMRKWA